MIMLLFVTAWAWRCGLAVPLTGLDLIFRWKDHDDYVKGHL